tara:strand:- start:415 stop:1308 length:894 start_codon:yes stop_codon:yes gene_type:complete
MDPNIPRIKEFNKKYLSNIKRSNLHKGPPPAHIEFDMHGSCSRRCAFCPRVDEKKWPNLEEQFEESLYLKVINELRDAWDYSGRISWSGYSEPTMHKDVFKLIKLTKKILPKCTLDIVSNGDFLDKEVIQKLYNSGLDHLRVSIYTNDKTTQKFKKIREELNINPEIFFIRERNKGRKNDFGLMLNNRAGAVNLKQIGIKREQTFPLERKCHYPLFKIFVNYNGDYQICSNDWNKKKIIGNANEKKIIDVWFSDEFSKIRKSLMKKNRNIDPCKTCDVKGDLNGDEFFDAWKETYKI